ncbi:DUF2007 domain-containing protein, partial [Dysosmobacter welbionis]
PFPVNWKRPGASCTRTLLTKDGGCQRQPPPFFVACSSSFPTSRKSLPERPDTGMWRSGPGYRECPGRMWSPWCRWRRRSPPPTTPPGQHTGRGAVRVR